MSSHGVNYGQGGVEYLTPAQAIYRDFEIILRDYDTVRKEARIIRAVPDKARRIKGRLKKIVEESCWHIEPQAVPAATDWAALASYLLSLTNRRVNHISMELDSNLYALHQNCKTFYFETQRTWMPLSYQGAWEDSTCLPSCIYEDAYEYLRRLLSEIEICISLIDATMGLVLGTRVRAIFQENDMLAAEVMHSHPRWARIQTLRNRV